MHVNDIRAKIPETLRAEIEETRRLIIAAKKEKAELNKRMTRDVIALRAAGLTIEECARMLAITESRADSIDTRSLSKEDRKKKYELEARKELELEMRFEHCVATRDFITKNPGKTEPEIIKALDSEHDAHDVSHSIHLMHVAGMIHFVEREGDYYTWYMSDAFNENGTKKRHLNPVR